MKSYLSKNQYSKSVNSSLGSKLTYNSTTKASITLKSSSIVTTKSSSTSTKTILKGQTNLVTSIKAPKEERKEKDQVAIISTILHIKTQLLSQRDLAIKLKEIEDINKQNKVVFLNWEITAAAFENESDLSNLVIAIEKVGPRVKHIKWDIRGSLSDTVGRTLGECLSKFPQLETLSLFISAAFGERFTAALSISLKKLVNLRILKLDNLKSKSVFTEKGKIKMNEAINSLTKLEFMSYSGYNWEEYSNLQSCLSNHVYIVNDFDQNHLYGLVQENQWEFEKQLTPLKDKIIDLQIKYESDGRYYNEMNISLFYDIYTGMLNYIIKLPYLTKLNMLCILNEDNEGYIEDTVKLTQQMKLINAVQELLKQKYVTLLKFSVFTHNLSKLFNFNPAFILQDLYFD